MKRSRICCCLLLLGTLLAIAGCDGGARYTYKGNEEKKDLVTIDNCIATPDSVIVPNKTNLHWVVTDKATYIVVFTKANTIQDPPPVVSSTLHDKLHTVHGGIGCSTVTPGLCGQFPYRLTKVTPDGSMPCPDPGVHVIP